MVQSVCHALPLLKFYHISETLTLPCSCDSLHTTQLVGVGFEVHDSHMTQTKPALQPSQQDAKPSKHKYVAIIRELGVTDVFQYGFCFIGIITGKG